MVSGLQEQDGGGAVEWRRMKKNELNSLSEAGASGRLGQRAGPASAAADGGAHAQGGGGPSAHPAPVARAGPPVRLVLGGRLVIAPLRRSVAGRVWALGLAILCGGILGFAATLDPDPTGYGTHRQVGFGPCGFLLHTGWPCPTCGMTTAYADFVRGRIWRSFVDQPTGFVLALATAVAGVAGLAAAISGRAVRVNWYRVDPVRVTWGFVVLFAASWGFKIIHGLACGTLPAR